MTYIGIDPGKNGGLAILNGEEVQTFRYDRGTYPDDPCESADCDWLRMLEEDALSCDNCKWLGKRHQKCSCCLRNHGIKDNYEGKTP